MPPKARSRFWIEVWLSADGWRSRIRARNNRIVWPSGEAYSSRSKALWPCRHTGYEIRIREAR